MRVRFRIIFLLVVSFSSQVLAQNQAHRQIDSLASVVSTLKEDTSKVKVLNNISFLYSSSNSVEGIKYGKEALLLSEVLGWNTGAADAHKNLGINYKLKRDLPNALDHVVKARSINESSGRKNALSGDLRAIGMVYFDKEDIDKCREFLLLSLEAAKDDKSSAALTLNNLGLLYQRTADYDKASTYYQKSLSLNQETGNQMEMARNYGNLASVNKLRGSFPSAQAYALKALKINEDLKSSKGIGYNLDILGSLFVEQGEAVKAREYFIKALQIAKESGDKYNMALALNKLGTTYHFEGNYDKMLDYEFQALKVHESINYQSGIANTIGHIAIAYSSQKKYSEAIRFYNRSIRMNELMANKGPLAYSFSNKAQVYFDIAKDSSYSYPPDSLIPSSRMEVLKKSVESFNRGIELIRQTGGLHLLQGALLYRSQAEAMMGDYVTALDSYKEHVIFKDSIYSQKKTAEMTQNMLRFEFGKREDSLIFQQQLTGHQLREQTLLAAQQTQQLLLTNKEKDLQQFAYLRTQADLQSEQNIRLSNEKALMIVKKENDLQSTSMALQLTQLALKDKELQSRKLQRNAFIAGLIGILLFSGFSFYRYRKLQRLEHHHAVLNERLRISRDLHDDMGATLSSISVYSTAVKQRLKDMRYSEAHTMLDSISEDARDMVSNMSDMVWMINPQNDLMEKLIDRMQLFASNVLSAQNIFVQFSAEESLKSMMLSMDSRKNIFLIFKEAINNIAKYAEATEVTIRVDRDERSFIMSINDNGKGFIVGDKIQGNGLRNMKQRAQEIKGKIGFVSAVGKGTTVSFTCYPHN